MNMYSNTNYEVLRILDKLRYSVNTIYEKTELVKNNIRPRFKPIKE